MKIVATFVFFYFMALNLFAQDIKYGHLAYTEADRSELMKAGEYPDGRPKMLVKETYEEFKSMTKAAEEEGIKIRLISAFRSKTHQKYLFERAVKRYGSEKEAAKRIAPPGFSQHHTGMAVDLGDGAAPETDLRQEFDGTKAYKWLAKNAKKYGFYLSFPKNNPQGVMYEPWHWCYKEERSILPLSTYEVDK